MGRTIVVIALLAGCAGEVTARVEVTPPPPAPAAAEVATAQPTVAPTGRDEDGDGITPDQCPSEAENKNDYQDGDGCPDETPPFFVAGDDVRYAGKIQFGLLGKVSGASSAIVEGIAALLEEHPEIELIDVGVHVAGSGDEVQKKSQERADDLVRALEKAGVARKRLRATGYGARCGSSDDDGVALRVVRRSGKDTGAPLCGTGV